MVVIVCTKDLDTFALSLWSHHGSLAGFLLNYSMILGLRKIDNI